MINAQRSGLIISLLVALACGIYSTMLGQDINWDLLNYHLYNPYAFLTDRIEFDLAPAGVQSFFSPMLDSVYFAAISHFSPKTVGFLIGFIQGLNFLLVYKVSSIVLREHRLNHFFCELIYITSRCPQLCNNNICMAIEEVSTPYS